MNEPIIGTVAEILNAKELVINRGSSHGMEIGMIFSIREKSALLITDPENENEELGSIDREKVRVRASEVLEKMTICKTFRVFVTKGRKGALGGIGQAGALQGMVYDLYGVPDKRVSETLKIEDSRLPPPLSPEQSIVKRGDRAVQIVAPLNTEEENE